ncbi:MAG: SH3 domain-containing protein [Rhodobacteraceae bacterium]|nr:SH3 domain-containing protein [Paracoccaceae bacterium]
MIRLMLLLAAGLYLTLLIGGADRGQMRFGLIAARQEAAVLAEQQATAAAVDTPVVSRAEVVQPQSPVVVGVGFAPPQPLMTPAPAPEAPMEERLGEVQYVTGRSVNVRSGPSTRDAVVAKLSRGEAVTVVRQEDNGWARVRIEGDGIDGYMSKDFLTDLAPWKRPPSQT